VYDATLLESRLQTLSDSVHKGVGICVVLVAGFLKNSGSEIVKVVIRW
jgi:hypothetical protein